MKGILASRSTSCYFWLMGRLRKHHNHHSLRNREYVDIGNAEEAVESVFDFDQAVP
jgi:hypothetical protein